MALGAEATTLSIKSKGWRHNAYAERSNEIPAAQALLAELGLAPGAVVTLDAMHCQKTF